ncbi:peptide ABC transporter substrate-binding protein [Spirochaeta isovalerica]|uniref:Peptide/nickel transport system substrate-binding protein/oligopeptide transport system substrate-binding protein n=1 Tax=Spirochaeta isovalerica TaxID=150 RepID=A0A841RHW4_9SPIO|nr:peptide ABC transporter substrate-binding protein [Spirochaeta isovalerica]MBB6482600.1 peptide/nickel transport system substrate-binding protein/oligopeptide transport system substrate-binding protein [Spirochaeta isovalerica]
MKKFIISFIIITAFSGLWAQNEFSAVFSEVDINFNPHKTFTSTEAQLYTAVFEGLVTYHPRTLEPLPAAARSWEISEDGLTYTFKLRRDLKYSNGDRLTAEHFRTSWLQLMSPESGSDYGSLLDIVVNGAAYRNGEADASEVGIVAESESVLKVTLEHRAPYLLKVLCHHSFSPVHPDFFESKGTGLIVNGPYRFEEIGDGRIVFRKNENYWDEENVEIEQLNIIFNDDPVQNSLDFVRNKTDWLADGFDLSVLNVDEAIVFNPLFSTTYLFFSNRNKVWSNGNVRKALALLLPWEKIRSLQMIPGSTLIPSIPDYPVAEGIKSSDTEQAMALLKQEGYENGEGLPPVLLRLPRSESMMQIGEMIQDSWKEHLNIDVNILSEPYPYYFSSLKKDDYTIGALTWIGDYADPMTFLEMWLQTSTLNDAGFSDSGYDEKIRKSSADNRENRYKLMSEAEKILLDSAQVMPLGHSPALNIIDLRFIDGWYPNVLDIHPFKYLKFKSDFQIPGVVSTGQLYSNT